jgi:hypothetical protein
MRAAFVLAALAALLVCCDANVKAEGEHMRKLLEHASQLQGQRTEELYGSEPPLVTENTIEEAKKMHIGAPINGMHAAGPARPQAYKQHSRMVVHHGMMLEGEQPSAFANIPAWVHILTFLGAVGTISLMFYLTERMWDKRQQSG